MLLELQRIEKCGGEDMGLGSSARWEELGALIADGAGGSRGRAGAREKVFEDVLNAGLWEAGQRGEALGGMHGTGCLPWVCGCV